MSCPFSLPRLIGSFVLVLLLATSAVHADKAAELAELVTYRLDQAGGETAGLIRFLDPEDIAGTAFSA